MNNDKFPLERADYIMLIIIALLLACCVIFTGCSSTKIWTFDKDGKAVKYEEVNTDIAGSIVQSTKDKTVIMWESGWCAYFTASPGTMEDPTPTLKGFGGKLDKGYMGIHKDHQNLNFDGIAKAIAATSKSLTVTGAGIGEKPVK
jgi:hypothetical protein